MELEELYKLMEEFGRSGLGKLEYKNGDCEVKLEMPEAAPVYNTFAAPQATVSTAAAAPVPAPLPHSRPPQRPERRSLRPRGRRLHKIPISRHILRGAGRRREPYVTAGSSVKKGETVCIVEAMKMMNEVVAPCNCIIEEVLKENATAAGFDEPLFRIGRYSPCSGRY